MPLAVYFPHRDREEPSYFKHLTFPIRTLHPTGHGCRHHFSILDDDKIPIYDVIKHRHTDNFDIFSCQPLSETSTDLSTGVKDSATFPVGTIDSDKDARKIKLVVNNYSFEILPKDNAGDRFELETSKWGTLTWERLYTGKYQFKCMLVGGSADKWIAVAHHEISGFHTAIGGTNFWMSLSQAGWR